MAIAPARFRTLALSLEGAEEVAHMTRAAFRTPRRIFATLAEDGASANLALDHDVQAAVCEALPASFAPVPGGWGRMGFTTVDLKTVSEPDLVRVLAEAHAASLPVKKSAKAKAPKPTAPKPTAPKATAPKAKAPKRKGRTTRG